MSTAHITEMDARQLVYNLRKMNLNDDAIYSRLILEGFYTEEAEEIMQLAPYQANLFPRNSLLSTFLKLYTAIMVVLLLIPIVYIVFLSIIYPGICLIFGLPLSIVVYAYRSKNATRKPKHKRKVKA